MHARRQAVLRAAVHVDAPLERVWQVVSDLRRMGEWSPECFAVRVWGGRMREGAWLTGVNRRKAVVWPTTSRIHRYDEGRAIGWTVLESGARWEYELAPGEHGGTRLDERREMPRGATWLAHGFATLFLGGEARHDEEALAGMHTTLARMKEAAERPAAGRGSQRR